MNNNHVYLKASLFLIGCSFGIAAPITVTESAEGFLFQEDGKKILFYQRAPKSFDGAYTRNNYIHPLWNLDGDVLTEDAPADHLHHRGIFWTWHQTYVGDTRCGDAWTCKRFAWDITNAKVKALPTGAQKLDVTVLWFSPDFTNSNGNPMPIVKEMTAITVNPRAQDYRFVDINIRLSALQDKVTIGGSEDVKGYGGFSLRLKAPQDLSFFSEGQNIKPKNEAVAAGNWMDFSASFNPHHGKSGIAVFVHPENPGSTNKWILRQKRSMQNAVYPGREPVVVSNTDPTTLEYRLVIHKRAAEQVSLADMYRKYANK